MLRDNESSRRTFTLSMILGKDLEAIITLFLPLDIFFDLIGEAGRPTSIGPDLGDDDFFNRDLSAHNQP